MTTTQDLAGTMTSFSITLVTTVCISCGIPFAIPENYRNRLKQTHECFWCPNGHTQHFIGQTEAERLAKLLRAKENELAQKISANIQLDSQLTKMKKEIASGKCPCCKKTYKHLANHMKNKHPKGI